MMSNILASDITVLLNGASISIIPASVEYDFGLQGLARVPEVLNGEIRHVGVVDISKNVGMIKFSTYNSEEAIKAFIDANLKSSTSSANGGNVIQLTFKSKSTVIVGTNMTLVSGLTSSFSPDAEIRFEFEGDPLSHNLL